MQHWACASSRRFRCLCSAGQGGYRRHRHRRQCHRLDYQYRRSPEQLAALVRQAADLSETQKKSDRKLEGELDLNQRQIRAALGILGENDIPPERLAAKLVEIAERFKDLQATASAQPGDGPKIVSLKADAQKAIDAGELAKADALLADVETEQRRALDRLAVNAAETSARRGEIALTRLRYAEAATHFANAAAVFPPNSATRTSESATSGVRQSPFTDRDTNSATTAPCSPQSSGSNGWSR